MFFKSFNITNGKGRGSTFSPSHYTKGNRRQQTFFSDQDFKAYLTLMAESCLNYKVEIWAYCLIPNHIHLIAVFETKDGLNLAVGEAHRRYIEYNPFRVGLAKRPEDEK